MRRVGVGVAGIGGCRRVSAAAIVARFRAGAAAREVMAEFAIAGTSAYRLRDQAFAAHRGSMHSPHRLSFEDRERILVGIAREESDAQIARALGRHRSTVGREIARCGGRCHYRALSAQRHARTAARRPKPTKLASRPRLLAEVERRLKDGCSPEQIAARLRLEFPDDPSMRVSHETIYQALYVQGVASCVASWLAVCGPAGHGANPRVGSIIAAGSRTW